MSVPPPPSAPTPPPGAPMPPPGYPMPVPPPPGAKLPDTRPKTMAIIALVTAGVGLILAFIPIVTFFSGLVLLAGFVLGLIALIAKKHGGTPLSITAIAVSVVGWIVSVVMSIASVGLIGLSTWEETTFGGSEQIIPEESSDAAEPDPDAGAPVPGDAAVADEAVAISEAVFGRDSYNETIWWYVVTFENPNPDYIFDFAEIKVQALSADGTILDTSSDYRTILSGPAAVTGQFYSVSTGEIAELKVSFPDTSEAMYAPYDETGLFTIEGIQANSDGYSTRVAGTVGGDFGEDKEGITITVVARDAAGKIIGAERSFVDTVPTGGKAQFEAIFLEDLPADTTFEAFASM